MRFPQKPCLTVSSQNDSASTTSTIHLLNWLWHFSLCMFPTCSGCPQSSSWHLRASLLTWNKKQGAKGAFILVVAEAVRYLSSASVQGLSRAVAALGYRQWLWLRSFVAPTSATSHHQEPATQTVKLFQSVCQRAMLAARFWKTTSGWGEYMIDGTTKRAAK